jgi:hypothetical protein
MRFRLVRREVNSEITQKSPEETDAETRLL